MLRFIYKPSVDDRLPPKIRKLEKSCWVKPVFAPRSFLVEENFFFLNKNRSLKDVGWDGPQCEKLWRYNQHYFNDLNSRGSHKRLVQQIRLLDQWIESNPPGLGVGWDPYPTSVRIVNWIKWSLTSNQLEYRHLFSLAVQVRWLTKNIEWHLLGNHLFANAKALVFAGLYFGGLEADRWLSIGVKILKSEINEQILSDGGHFELSPMYHSIILEDVLDIINLIRDVKSNTPCELLPTLEATANNMFMWLQFMCHPDGQISFFNDAAFNTAKSPDELKKYAKRLNLTIGSTPAVEGLHLKHLNASGYLILREPEATLLVDAAAVGASYLPGHGHADTLSFEMSIFGSRIFVNSGTSEYKAGATRDRERSTAAHNTVEVNGLNSSEVWAQFRVARRARTFDLSIEQNQKEINVKCSHDGYTQQIGNIIHTRNWSFSRGNLIINDKLGGYFKLASANFILHPSINIKPIDDNRWQLSKIGLEKSIELRVLKGAGKIACATFAPEFGKKIDTSSIKVIFDKFNEICVEISWCTNEKA
jgi:uncharacterized heparinase superfamily protein